MDWNDDGLLDILSGCYWTSGADAAHIQLLAGRGEMDFAPAVALKNAAGVPLTNVQHKRDKDVENDYEWRNICTHQHAVDYDGDGDLDLVVGCMRTQFFFVENSGDAGAPALSDKPQQLSLSVPGGHGGPHLVDWDGDGDLDLLSGGGGGGVFLSENVGRREAPEWAAFKQLVPPSQKQGQFLDNGEEIVPAGSTRVWATDWNGDGRLDLLVGDNVTVSKRKPGVSEVDYKRLSAEHVKKMADFMREYQKVAERYGKAQEEGEASKELKEELQKASSGYSEIYQAKSEFVDERRTGFVWLFLRRAAE